jgi:hypothetical protein
VARTRVRIFLREILNAIASRFSPGLDDSDFYEGEGDCTSETGAGQFSIFGAIEEKDGRGFPRIGSDEMREEKRVLLRWMAVISCAMHGVGEIWRSGASECPQRVHRKCRKASANETAMSGWHSRSEFSLGSRR